MNYFIGTTGYVERIDTDDTAYVTSSKVPAGKDPLDYYGRWWRIEDLRVISSTKWRRQKCV